MKACVVNLWSRYVLLLAAFFGLKSCAFVPSTGRRKVVPIHRYASVAGDNAPGYQKRTLQDGGNIPLNLGDIATIKYSCYLNGDNSKSVPFARSSAQKMVVGDGTMIKGWDLALRTMKVGERAIVRITDPELGYGPKGFPPLIPPNAEIEFDVEILNSQEPMANFDFDSLAIADNTPRTAGEIAAAYERRQALKAAEPEKEGLEAFIDKVRNFYFFGLFEGETGQQAPWFLRPSITFPLAFLVVGAAFYVSLASGGISTRGAQVTDELDEIILSSTVSSPALMLALNELISNGIKF